MDDHLNRPGTDRRAKGSAESDEVCVALPSSSVVYFARTKGATNDEWKRVTDEETLKAIRADPDEYELEMFFTIPVDDVSRAPIGVVHAAVIALEKVERRRATIERRANDCRSDSDLEWEGEFGILAMKAAVNELASTIERTETASLKFAQVRTADVVQTLRYIKYLADLAGKAQVTAACAKGGGAISESIGVPSANKAAAVDLTSLPKLPQPAAIKKPSEDEPGVLLFTASQMGDYAREYLASAAPADEAAGWLSICEDEIAISCTGAQRAKLLALDGQPIYTRASPAAQPDAQVLAKVSPAELRDIQSGLMAVPVRSNNWRNDQTIPLYLATTTSQPDEARDAALTAYASSLRAVLERGYKSLASAAMCQTRDGEAAWEAMGEALKLPIPASPSHPDPELQKAEQEAQAAQARSWLKVWWTLAEVCPGFHTKHGKGEECAILAIRDLAARAKGSAPNPVQQQEQGYDGTIDTVQCDSMWGFMYVTVKLPREGLPEELRTIGVSVALAQKGK